MNHTKSEQIYAEALKHIVGGVNFGCNGSNYSSFQ